MSEIKKAIVISDLHLGKVDGYHFSRDSRYADNRKTLFTLLKSFGQVDEIILNGDILDLAMAGLDVVYAELKVFFQLLAEVGNHRRIVYLPGNHDHHFWRMLGEQIQIHGNIMDGKPPPGHDQYACRFVDQRYSSLNPVHAPHIIFPHLWPRALSMPEFVIKYPHHLVKVPSSNTNYMITHGHFLEDLFKPVNYLIEPNRLAQLEAFNNVWLEAFDYYLGHSDELSNQGRELEKRFLEGGKEAKEKVSAILDSVYRNMKKTIGFRFPMTCLVRFVLKQVLKLVPKEKMGQSIMRGAEVNDKLITSIQEYIEKYILNRYQGSHESKECPQSSGKEIPTPFSFIFGHTHIPFSDHLEIDGLNYPIHNTGGWIRSDGDASGNGKYAGIIFIDEKGAHWHSMEGKLK